MYLCTDGFYKRNNFQYIHIYICYVPLLSFFLIRLGGIYNIHALFNEIIFHSVGAKLLPESVMT